MDVAELSIRVRSQEARTGAETLDGLATSAGRAEIATQRLSTAAQGGSTAVQRMTRGLMANRTAVQQASFQVQDLVTQLSMGTAATVALGQQLPQLLGSFGAIGAAAGALAAIALPAIGIAMAAAGSNTRTFGDALDETETALRGLADANEAARMSVGDLVAEYGTANPQLRETLEILATIAQADAAAAVIGLTSAFRSSINDLTGWNESTERAIERILGLEAAVGEWDQAVTGFNQSLLRLEAATTIEEAARIATFLRDAIIDAAGGVENLNAEQRQLVANLSQVVLQGTRLKSETEGAAAAAGALSDRMLAAYRNYASTRMEAEGLAAATREAAAAMDAASLAYGRIMNTGESGPDAARRSVMGLNAPGLLTGTLAGGAAGVRAPATPTGSVGSGGGTDPFADQLAQLMERIEGERVVIETWYAEAEALLNDRRAREILGEQAHKDAMLEVERLYQQQIGELQASAEQQRLTNTTNLFGALASVAQSGGERLAKIAAGFAAVEGTVNAYAAAIDAMRRQPGNVGVKIAAYASVLAAGLRGVAAIRQAGGIGGGGGGARATAGAAPAQQAPQTVVLQGLRADDLVTGQQVFDLLYQENNNRGRVFQVLR